MGCNGYDQAKECIKAHRVCACDVTTVTVFEVLSGICDRFCFVCNIKMVKEIKSMVTLCYNVIRKVQYAYYFEKLRRRFVMRLIRYRYERD